MNFHRTIRKIYLNKSIALFLFMSHSLFPAVIRLKTGVYLQGEIRSESTDSVSIDLRNIRGSKRLVDKFLSGAKLDAKSLMGSARAVDKDDVLVSGSPFVGKNVEVKTADVGERPSNRTSALKLKGASSEIYVDESQLNKTHFVYYDFLNIPDPAKVPPGTKAEILVSKPLTEVDSISVGALDTVGNFTAKEKMYPDSWFKPIAAMSFNEWDPRVGLLYSPLVPVGAVSEINFGAVGMGLYASTVMPLHKFLPLEKFSLRTRWGIYSGYNAFTTEQEYSSSSITLIPVMGVLSLYYDFPKEVSGFKFSPAFKWYQGVIFSSVTKELKPQYISQLQSGSPTITGSYIGYATQWTLGVEARHKSEPRLAYFVDIGYMAHAEDLSGTFFTTNFGVAWHFYKPVKVKVAVAAPPGVVYAKLDLSGVVKSMAGKPIPAEIIVKEKESGEEIKKVSTDAKGKYSVTLDPGFVYTIEATKAAHVKSGIELDLTQNKDAKKTHDFSLLEKQFKLENVNFEGGNTKLLKQSFKALDGLADFLQKNPDVRISIDGHTAKASGSAEENIKFSKDRSQVVKDYLVKKGIAESRLVPTGYGDTKPVADNNTKAGMAKNRRVEVTVLSD